METKTCGKCFETHSIDFFNRDCTRADKKHPWCKTCTRDASKRTQAKKAEWYRQEKRRWKRENPEKVAEMGRAYRKADPDRAYRYSREYWLRRKQATPPWVDQAALDFIRDMCPPGFEIDHIHPLKNKDFCGLNVPWNLQFLTRTENAKKSNKLLDQHGGLEKSAHP